MSVHAYEVPAAAAGESWSVDDASALYRVESWGEPYFFVDENGQVAVRALDTQDTTMAIPAIVAELRRRGVQMPVLLRFQDILSAQVRRINEAFSEAIAEAGYDNVYRGIYPIKVNQLHEVVDELLDAGRAYGMGLECGSKAELIATLPHVNGETLLVCNGVKDRTMLSLMMSAQRLGQNVVPVVEKYSEFVDINTLAEQEGFAPVMGVRVRLATRGSGRWSESSGSNSKFGLRVAEVVRMVGELERTGRRDKLVLLHCHIGSQVADIQVLKQAIKEVAQIYSALVQRGVGLKYLDVGGGLGVNYCKGQLGEHAGINYSLQEYANAVVFTVKEVCEANEVPVPVIVTESGRALTAHHSVLIVPVIGAQSKDDVSQPLTIDDDADEPVQALARIVDYLPGTVEPGELTEALHDANERLEDVRNLFTLGYMSLEQRALAERLYWRVCTTLLESLRRNPEASETEINELEVLLTDQYLCDFSVFQSMLDHWAIGQPFPIMPIERLQEQPTRRAILVDLTCDSDGKVTHYVSAHGDGRFLPVHTMVPGEPYYLGFFLMGAYEDIVGDAHNLFGRVSEAHIYADAEEPGNFWIEKVIPGTAVQDMLAQVQYFPNDLHRRMNELIRGKIQAGVVRPSQGMEILDQYMACFPKNTYCDPGSMERDA
jgi:arginine decarboxylase